MRLEREELGIAVPACVLQARQAPPEKPGEGCLVLMTVRRVADDVPKLRRETGTEIEAAPVPALTTGWRPLILWPVRGCPVRPVWSVSGPSCRCRRKGRCSVSKPMSNTGIASLTTLSSSTLRHRRPHDVSAYPTARRAITCTNGHFRAGDSVQGRPRRARQLAGIDSTGGDAGRGGRPAKSRNWKFPCRCASRPALRRPESAGSPATAWGHSRKSTRALTHSMNWRVRLLSGASDWRCGLPRLSRCCWQRRAARFLRCCAFPGAVSVRGV